MPLLELEGIRRHYRQNRTLFAGNKDENAHAPVRAVDGVDLAIEDGETLGLVGESGCGKSTLARIICGLEEPSEGVVRWQGEDLTAMDPVARAGLHRNVQMVFQDPHASLDPRRSVGESIAEGIRTHKLLPKAAIPDRVAELLEQVGLNPENADRYPHQFSGGQLQRVGIARALAVEPKLLVCDEPVSALDLSVRAQVLNLLNRLKRELGLAIIFIAHDLDVVQHMSDRIVTMYLGKIVESGSDAEVYDRTAHPYTRALLSAIPRKLAPGESLERIVLQGDPPSPIAPPPGCPFHTRCYTAVDKCRTDVPVLDSVPGDGPDHRSACFLAAEVSVSDIGRVTTTALPTPSVPQREPHGSAADLERNNP
ncbi:ABC transporter ATP-binding protein [Microbacterium gorillae]|uniref:ABC transporter ATP-binding protein n=1 Tax=Microbacterium gorillae TaxID=1231063 RepID=UPI000A88D0E6|nr:oligopeptide/dipeptide ABC transporter ATP-binding protein [Microbacterium gorillae]